ncbi:hypothetical protein C0J26_09275 [Pseudomonas baetica]|nr:hypothetical protein C0J26_09275 [Pseudomonas baetica]
MDRPKPSRTRLCLSSDLTFKFNANLLWERARSRKRCISQHHHRLLYRLREQARSHIKFALFQCDQRRVLRIVCSWVSPASLSGKTGKRGSPTSRPV